MHEPRTLLPERDDAARPRDDWVRLLFPSLVATLVFGWSVAGPLPTPGSVRVVEGTVASAKWVGLKYRRFEVRLTGWRQTFDVRSPVELTTPLVEMIRPGDAVRIGHGGGSVGMFGSNDATPVRSLEVAGRPVFTLEQSVAEMRTERVGGAAAALVSGALFVFSFRRWLRLQAAVADYRARRARRAAAPPPSPVRAKRIPWRERRRRRAR